jgi:hypothetical protein
MSEARPTILRRRERSNVKGQNETHSINGVCNYPIKLTDIEQQMSQSVC